MKRTLALILSLVMCLGLLAGCGDKKDNQTKDENTPLVVGYAAFNEKFSPFFSETEYDQDVWVMTSLDLLNSDRQGQIIMNGIEGETHAYNGTDYTYYGPADCEIVENADGTVDYNFTMRDDIVFSDGEKVTIDDVIFSMYVLCDPTYDGNSTLYAVPIQGMAAYRSGMTTLAKALAAAGRDNADFTYWTEEQQTKFWDNFDKGLVPFAQGIVDACVEAGMNDEGDVAGAAANWGFDGLAADATVEDFAMAIGEQYGWSFSAMEKEVGNSDALSAMMDEDVYADYPTIGVKTGDSAANISGIKKTGDYSMTVTLDKVDATAIYQLGVTIAPLHYYGDTSLYDYDNNQFGFPKGDLSSVRAKTTSPMGAGPYKYIKYEDGVVYFEANDSYFLGAPKTKYLNFQQCMSDDDKLNGVITGTIDIADPSFSNDTVDAIEKANGGVLDGDKITTNTVDNLGYGYIGMNAKLIPDLYARRALAYAMNVELTLESYSGGLAEVIYRPMSKVSWAYPQGAEDMYPFDGTGEKSKEMFLMSDNYKEVDGKIVNKDGSKVTFTFTLPADAANHPAGAVFTEAQTTLAKIGVEVVIDVNANVLNELESDTIAVWAAAWQATIDPDMFQVYYSDPAKNTAGSPKSYGLYYKYTDGSDEEKEILKKLNELIDQGRTSLNVAERKPIYAEACDLVMEMAVEIPTYQRKNMYAYDSSVLDDTSFFQNITPYKGPLSEIWNVSMK